MPISKLSRRLLHLPSADWDRRQIRRAFRGPQPGPDAIRRLEAAAERTLGIPVVAFGGARSAIAALLLAARPAGGRVILPAFTCVAVPNAVRAAGLVAVWVDVEGANLDPDVVRLTAQSGDAILAQHTYGVPVALGLGASMRERDVFVIEDRAHRFDGEAIEGDAVVFSLEHSKVVSGGQGGLAWAADDRLMDELRRIRDGLPSIDDHAAGRVLRTSATQAALAAIGGVTFGASSLARRLALRLPAISIEAQSLEELGGGAMALHGPHPALAEIAISSIERAHQNRDHRRRIADVYRNHLADLVPAWLPERATLVRMPLLVGDAVAITGELRRRGWDLGSRWFEAPIHPTGSASDYVPGTSPAAERLARRVLSLPTHPRIEPATARRLAEVVSAIVNAT